MLNIYVIFDRLTETWGNPFFLLPKAAARTFEWMVKDTAEKDRQDKEIWCLGTYNPETAEIQPMAGVKVFNLDSGEAPALKVAETKKRRATKRNGGRQNG